MRFYHRSSSLVTTISQRWRTSNIRSSLRISSSPLACATAIDLGTTRATVGRFSTTADAGGADTLPFTNLVSGPPVQFGMGKVATLAEASVIGSSGQTVALATMASASMESMSLLQPIRELSLPDALRQLCKERASFVPLTVDYRQRHHAVGKIPTSSTRTDNKAPTSSETLAGRAIDRALRPLLKPTSQSLHISCSIQSCPIKGDVGGYPVSLALNAASVALKHRLSTPVAAVFLSLHEDGTVTADPSTPDQSAVGSLLYAGTRDKVVMMEFSGLLSESTLNDLITLAHGCVQPLLDIQEDVAPPTSLADSMDDDAVRAELGLELEGSAVVSVSADAADSDAQAQALMESALSYCREKLANASLKLFGVADPTKQPDVRSIGQPQVHPKNQPALRSKAERGRREHIFQKAVLSTLQQFQPEPSMTEAWTDIIDRYPGIVADMAEIIHSQLLREAIGNAAIQYHSRADGRGSKSTDGCTTVRPLSMEVPALPGVVHGSSLFTRGETQVLCTVTLGPPKDGILLNDPFNPPKEAFLDEPVSRPSDDLPVGSLRYLKTQEYLESDLNSRKVRADREQTGDSGVLKERRRAFLQYDFPAYSKGEVQSGPRGPNRREIGHGALAEKAVLPILPPASEFPYAMRMTSEVTGSNGSSSMASVCGATLALLDAGVPIKAPVAGVSVGLAMDAHDDNKYQLLLDITGTEDHYGIMDFKIAGTRNEVTAMHLDVHAPLPHAVVFEALDLARNGRGVILDEMSSQAAHSSKWAITDLSPRPEQKPSAPRVEVVRFDPMRKKDLLGPGGAVIRQMEDRFNVSLDLTQEGQCLLFGDDREMVRKAKVAVMDLVADVEVGGVYEGTVIELRDFGAIIELLRNKEGLCHVSELARRDEIRAHPEGTVGLINSILRVGQKIDVECTAVDTVMGTIRVRPAKKDSN